MHDIIGHNLSVITGLADGGRYAAAKSPERAAQALDAIATTSRQALTGLRRLLDVLREEEKRQAHLTPQPALTDLAPLLEAYVHHLPAGPTAQDGTAEDARLTSLTDREREIHTVIGQGWTNTEIATRLHLAESTVKTHVGRILAKTGSRDRIQAVILAYDTKLVQPS